MDEQFGRRYDDERRFGEPAPRDYGYEARRYRGEGHYGGRGPWERRDRGFLDRAGDEVRSWFGDEEAERRRREDERQALRHEGAAGRWGERERPGRVDYGDRRERGGADDFDERAWARQWGHLDPPHERQWTFGDRPRMERRSEGYGETAGPRDDVWTPRGPFSGRGPKGYQRSDERIREDVCDLLCEHGALDASGIEVQVLRGEVTLLGSVSSRTQKRLAEDLADSISGVNEIHNQLRVNQPAPAPPPATPEIPPAPPQDWRNRAA